MDMLISHPIYPKMDEEPNYGPAMLALTEMQRRFVIDFVATGGVSRRESVVRAGYSNVGRNGDRMGFVLVHDPRIQSAINEECRRALKGDLPSARFALSQILTNSAHKDHFSAVKLVLAIEGLSEVHKSEKKVKHTHKVDRAGLMAEAKALESRLGLTPGSLTQQRAPRQLNGPIIDVTPEMSISRKTEFDP